MANFSQSVYDLQRKLNAAGYRDQYGEKLKPDGIVGPKTQYALSRYNKEKIGEKNIGVQNPDASYTAKKMASDLATVFDQQRTNNSAKKQSANNAVIIPPIDTEKAKSKSWTAQKQATDPLLKKLEQAMAADDEAQVAFKTTDDIKNEQEALNLLGFTGLDDNPLPENGILDLNTLVAWDKLRHPANMFGYSDSSIMQTLRDQDNDEMEEKSRINQMMQDQLMAHLFQDDLQYSGSSTGDGNAFSVPDPHAKYLTEEEIKKNPLAKQFNAGMANLSCAPVRAYYNTFNDGEYDPNKAKNCIDKFFRGALTGQDILNEQADLAVAMIDDSTNLGKFEKQVLAPFAREIPGLLLDTAIIWGTGGTALPALSAKTGVKEGAKILLNDLRYVAAQPVTIERTVNYFLATYNEQVEAGIEPEVAAVQAINYSIPAALTDGMGMTVPKWADKEILSGNIGRLATFHSKKAARDLVEDKWKDMIKEEWKEFSI